MRDTDVSNLSRRAVLLRGTWLSGLALGLSACRKPRRHTATPDPDASKISATLASEVRLVQMYDAAIAANLTPRGWLSAGRDAHKAHVDALTKTPQLIGQSTPSTPRAQLAALAAAEHESAVALRAAAVALRDGDHAALLASIAAAHEAHASLHPVVPL
jgi:hypothetical protein